MERFIHNYIMQSLHNLSISGNKIKNTPFWEFKKKYYTSLENLPRKYVYVLHFVLYFW